MAADIMAQRVLFRASVLALFWGLLLTGCISPDQKIRQRWINSATENLQQSNGVTLLDGAPFTGTVYTLYAQSGDTLRIGQYLQGKEHGLWKQFYPGHRLREQRSFDRGRKTGELIAWGENGRKLLHYFFENDEYEGTCREWNAQGQLVQEMHYHQGHEEGPQKMYYDNGKIRSNYIVREGRRYGLLGTKNCVNVSDSVFVQPETTTVQP